MQTRVVTLKHYRQIGGVLPFHGLDDKLRGVVLGAFLIPLAATGGFLALDGADHPALGLLFVGGVAGAGAALAAWVVHHLLAPIRMTVKALRTYATEQRVLPLPTDLTDDMGELLRDLRRTLEGVQESQARAQLAASEDPLTGLPALRRSEEYLKLAATAIERSGGRLCIGLVELDRLPALNEQRGTDAGDRANRQLGEFLKLWLKRKTDWVGRWTGDAFILVMFADQNGTTEYLANLQREFARQMRSFEDFGLTISIGIAERQRHESVEQFLANAQEALYAARDEQDGRVVGAQAGKVRAIGSAARTTKSAA